MTTWRCPLGHEVPDADRGDYWCRICRADVIAIGARSDPPEYQPDEDAMAATWADAMHEGLPDD